MHILFFLTIFDITTDIMHKNHGGCKNGADFLHKQVLKCQLLTRSYSMYANRWKPGNVHKYEL